MVDILPDCRLKQSKGIQFYNGRPWVPVFCANCGRPGGYCPEENMTFLFYLCTPCSEKLGDIPGTWKMPDEVFHEKVRQAQIEEFGRLLTPEEIDRVVAEGSSPLAVLLTKG